MNEITFFLHALVLIVFSLISLKLHKNLLISWVIVQLVIANIFVLKQVSIFSMNVTTSEPYAVGVILSLNLLQEFYGKQVVRKAIYISFSTLFAFIILPQIHLLYVPIQLDYMHTAYFSIFNKFPRIAVASFATYVIVQAIDIQLFALLKKQFTKLALAARIFISIAISQLLDTLLFSILALMGEVQSILDIAIMSYSLKMITAILVTPFTVFAKKYFYPAKKYEAIF